ncbi:MAG: cyclic nucleotide-binding domain-containing protein [Syntrophobacteraceae bacterium]|jgi:CRP-like cAMP-binding protein|nr:cyclic nucleotide-binding domain-containing protein [Syntrophobacteraceae bacterium]
MEQHSRQQALEVRAYPYGGIIVREGDDCEVFYVVLSGEVQISERGRNIRVLSPHDTFGLESVVFKKPSSYTARAITETRVASYGPDALDRFIRGNPRMAQSILKSLLHQLKDTTRTLADESGDFSIEGVRVHYYGDGDKIIEEGAMARVFFRLVSSEGGLRVTSDGEEIAVIRKPGEIFGEMACLLDAPHQSTVTSLGPSTVEVYELSDMDAVAKDNPELVLQMMRALVGRLSDPNLKKPKTLH